MLASHNQLVVDEFRGLMTTPDFRDVPPEYSPGPCENIAFIPGGFRSRPGAANYIDLLAGTNNEHGEVFVHSSSGERYFLWLMDTPPVIYYSQLASRFVIFTPHASTIRFRVIPYGSRAYLFMSDGKVGLQEPRIWDVTNLDPMTVAQQSVGSLAAADGAAGSVTVGVHKLWMIYETRAGFRINSRSGGPSSDGKISFTAAGAKKIDMTVIPVHADASVVKRHIAMTEAALEAGYIALTINDNTSTTGTINLSDAQLKLQTSVDNYNQHSQPAASGMAGVIYNERMILLDGTSRAWVSEVGLPHTFRSDIGYIDVGVNDGEYLRNCFVKDGVLYLVKNSRTYYTQDNGGDPVDWPVREFSRGFGTPSPTGVDANDAEGIIAVLDFKGLYVFSGGRMIALSRNIYNVSEITDIPAWETFEQAMFYRAKVAIDPFKKRIFCLLPTEGQGGALNTTLVCDYSEGLSPESVKWSEWKTTGPAWRGFLMETVEINRVMTAYTASRYVQYFISSAGWRDSTTNALTGVETFYPAAWKYRLGVLGGKVGMTLFEEIEMKCKGGGNLVIEVFDPDGVSVVTLSNIALAATPGKNYTKLMNVVKENMFLELRQASPTASFVLNHITVYAKPDGTR